MSQQGAGADDWWQKLYEDPDAVPDPDPGDTLDNRFHTASSLTEPPEPPGPPGPPPADPSGGGRAGAGASPQGAEDTPARPSDPSPLSAPGETPRRPPVPGEAGPAAPETPAPVHPVRPWESAASPAPETPAPVHPVRPWESAALPAPEQPPLPGPRPQPAQDSAPPARPDSEPPAPGRPARPAVPAGPDPGPGRQAGPPPPPPPPPAEPPAPPWGPGPAEPGQPPRPAPPEPVALPWEAATPEPPRAQAPHPGSPAYAPPPEATPVGAQQQGPPPAPSPASSPDGGLPVRPPVPATGGAPAPAPAPEAVPPAPPAPPAHGLVPGPRPAPAPPSPPAPPAPPLPDPRAGGVTGYVLGNVAVPAWREDDRTAEVPVPEAEEARPEVRHLGDRAPTYAAEPGALPAADPAALDDLTPDTVLEGARYGTYTLRAASLRGDSARYRGEARRDCLLTARFGTGEDALVMVVLAGGDRAAPGGPAAAAELCRTVASAVGRSQERLSEDIRAGRRDALRSGLQRLTDRGYGRLRAHAAELGLAEEAYTAGLRALLLPVDPQCRTRVCFGSGAGGLFRLRSGEWQDLEPGEGASEGDFRFRASVARPGDTLLVCSVGLAGPMREEAPLPAELAARWSDPQPPGLAAFLADTQLRLKGYADDRTAAAVWEE
ncbi:protein phosphatase 2C domain-containing protein [Streptomyces sp. NPDC096339]|uniref:protein phosphatase 2C domain-containing protein n=1 Tax=Streptomyces sp. NPDC096339 TaxID=3366086 RepID=UPI0038251720